MTRDKLWRTRETQAKTWLRITSLLQGSDAELRLAPTRKPDGHRTPARRFHSRPLRKTRGTRRAKPRRRGCPFKVRAKRYLIRQTSFRDVERKRLQLQRGKQLSDDGRRSKRRPEGRWPGDIGGCWNCLLKNQTFIARDPNRRGDDSTNRNVNDNIPSPLRGRGLG